MKRVLMVVLFVLASSLSLFVTPVDAYCYYVSTGAPQSTTNGDIIAYHTAQNCPTSTGNIKITLYEDGLLVRTVYEGASRHDGVARFYCDVGSLREFSVRIQDITTGASHWSGIVNLTRNC